jgi:tRNA (cmo5U34)-methyltransferase
MTEKDNIFRQEGRVEDFKFNEEVVNVFDDMVVRSVPFYEELQRMLGEIAKGYCKPNTRIYDFGCSTGTTLMSLMHEVDDASVSFVGIDNSKFMLEKAKANVQKYKKKSEVSFIEADLNKVDMPIEDASVVIMNWTLQFVRPIYRAALLKHIYDGMAPGGVLLICEKILLDDSNLNRLYIDLYYAFKRRNGYSELEIAQKREALENILMPCTVKENVELLKGAGFGYVDTFFRWYNWAGIISLKQL